jgi:hypothetical protein
MYLDALSFLDDERDAWRPFEALEALDDEQLARPIPAAHGWSGRDLMGHLLAWQEVALVVARELAVDESSPTKARSDREWDELGGEVINERYLAAWDALSMAEVRRRFREVPGELRGYLTVVPEARWVKDAANLEFFLDETMDHYADHVDDLKAILAEVG